MQRIEVKNFGPLNDIVLGIRDYMVFIGPQASGKSTLAKLIYFFWKVEDLFYQEILPTYILNKSLKAHAEDINYVEVFKKDIRRLFTDIFPSFRNGELTFIYSKHFNIIFNVTKYNIKSADDISLGKGFLEELDNAEKRISSSDALASLLRNNQFKFGELIEIISTELSPNSNGANNRLINSKRIFVPAGRAILSILSNTISFVENNSVEYFTDNFIRFTNVIRRFLESRDYADNFGWMTRLDSENAKNIRFEIANQLSLKILKGDFGTDNKGDGIMQYYNGFGYLVPLRYTSSGQQESTWLINAVQYLLFESEENQFDVIIEEPEAHLFPDAQRDITKLITLLTTQQSHKTRVIVTTHSPYVLATLNNSLKAFTIAQKEDKSEKVENILEKEFWINPENLFVGFMKKIGSEEVYNVHDIFDQELKLIKHEVLDNVSDDIMAQFDDLLEIQYSE